MAHPYDASPVLVAGSGKLTWSIAVCLLQAGHPVTLFTDAVTEAQTACRRHVADIQQHTSAEVGPERLTLVSVPPDARSFPLAVAVAPENLANKKKLINQLESLLPNTATLAMTTESFDLCLLQEDMRFPGRLVGANWTEPAHTTQFLELIGNDQTDSTSLENVANIARTAWGKDPYCLSHGSGIRQRLMGALVREAMYLVENDYASVEDIDRACRNDAGYYLPFAGNCRYMDLMGTYAYGLVMQELNPELAKDNAIATFYSAVLDAGKNGMENDAGFFTYQPGDVADWEEKARRFSYQIQEIIEKYPFPQPEELDVIIPTNLLSNAE